MGESPEILVLGAGVIGLTTALELQLRGHRVEIWSRDDPGATTSAVAAAMWYPFLAEPAHKVLEWSRTTFEVLEGQARDPATGVQMVRFVETFASADPEVPWASICPTLRRLSSAEVARLFACDLPTESEQGSRLGPRSALEMVLPVADTRLYLPWLVECLRAGGAVFRKHAVADLAEALERSTRAVVNCTGLGARELCDDTTLVPIRGQVLVVPRSAWSLAADVEGGSGWIDDSGAHPVYAIPRGDEVVLGGTAQRGDANLEVDAADSARILAGLQRRVPGLGPEHLTRAKVGLRPYRPTIRLERDELRDGGHERCAVLIHNYGHGGSGYTLSWGCAREVAAQLES